jgi:hypothetical protein
MSKANQTWLAAGMLLGAMTPLFSAELIPVAGQLAGRVTNPGGLPQMGASVSLIDRYEAVVGRVLTSEAGAFEFPMLPAGVYSIQVSMPSLVSVFRKNIAVQPGMRSFVAVNLSTLLSSIEFVYLAPAQRALMSEDWKWVLRGSGGTRPGLRILPGSRAPQPAHVRSAMFENTEGLIKVSAGDGASTSAFGHQTDLGTAFAVATSLFGGHRLEVSGNLGYASNAGVPTAGFRTSFSPLGQNGAQVGITMRQVFLAGRAGVGMLTGSQSMPVLRTYEASLSDRRRIAENLLLEYGSTLESVMFVDRLNFFSPYARVSWGSDQEGLIQAGYSSGAPPVALMGSQGAVNGDQPINHLQDDISSLAMLPRVSLAQGRARVQRTENLEIGYVRSAGGRTLAASIYQETLRNAAAMMGGADGVLAAGDILPDLGSRSSIFNYGRFQRRGATLMVTQSLGQYLNASVGYTYTGALEAPTGEVDAANASAIRGHLGRRVNRRGLLARVSGTLPRAGTVYSASYQWTDYRAFQPSHYSLVQRSQFDPGLNVSVRQPIPGVSGMFPGRIEASAELRNLMAQGYVPLNTLGGQRLLLIHSPRAVRGGLSFIF